MEEKKLVERPLMSEKEFKDNLSKNKEDFYNRVANGELFLKTYLGVSKFKSIKRAIRRGHVSIFGDIYPKRPFGNTRTKQNDLKRKIYAELRRRQTI